MIFKKPFAKRILFSYLRPWVQFYKTFLLPSFVIVCNKLDCLSLVLYTNIILCRKSQPRTNTGLLQRFVHYVHIKFYNIGPRLQSKPCIKLLKLNPFDFFDLKERAPSKSKHTGQRYTKVPPSNALFLEVKILLTVNIATRRVLTFSIRMFIIMTNRFTKTIIGSDISIKSLKRKTKHQRRLQFNQHVKRAF